MRHSSDFLLRYFEICWKIGIMYLWVKFLVDTFQEINSSFVHLELSILLRFKVNQDFVHSAQVLLDLSKVSAVVIEGVESLGSVQCALAG